MKTTKLLWGILACVLLSFVASCTEEEKEPPIDGTVTDENGPITIQLTDITATTALFKGSVNLDYYSKYDEVGIIYSLAEDLEMKPLVTNVVPITNIDKNNRFEKKMRELLCNTKYYYSSYICVNGIYKFGEIQSFTTDDVKMELSSPTVTSTTATFTGKVTVEEEDFESLSFCVAWSEINDFQKEVNEEEVEFEDDGAFTLTIKNLKMDTEYFYSTCIHQLDSEYGEQKKFTTAAAAMSVTASQITQTSVTFTGKAEKNSADESIEYGILYSTDPKLEVGASGCVRKVLTDVFDASRAYTLKVDGLINDTKYYYCWYACQGSDYKYGTSQTFTTSSVAVTVSVNPITQTTATFTGSYSRLDGDEIEVGILYSLSSSGLTVDSPYVTKIILNDANFTHKVEGLNYNTSYYYCTYICQNGKYKYSAINSFKTKNITVKVSASDITTTTVTFSGKAEILDSDVIEVGILYSTSNNLLPTESSTNRKVLNNGDFSFTAENLQNGTKYYYKYYIKYAGSYAYGEIHEFTTGAIAATLSEPSVTQTTATFSGNVNIEDTSLIQFGILYSTSSTLSATSSNKISVTSLKDGAFSCKAKGLTHSTKYYYCYYVCQDGTYTYGTTRTFATLDLPWDSAENLSIKGTANCYIVSKSGWYKIKAQKGNSSEAINAIKTAEVLWESFGTSVTPSVGDLIQGVSYRDGYIGFQTAESFKEGNAVIAAKDANDNILWSWHIWLTDQPEGQEYYNDAGTMMDRNLGATSATPGDVGALGLLYQWGRKDPFLGSSSISFSTLAKSTLTWPSAMSSDSNTGTISYATTNPTTFITYNDSNYDWYYTGDSSTDNTRWTTSSSTKSIYDPCPAGWRVPDGGNYGVWAKALGSIYRFNQSYDSTNEGMNFSGKFGSASTVWYPASSSRDHRDGSLDFVGYGGYYWSASSNYNYAYYLYLSNYGDVFPSDDYCGRAYGQSVRCLQE